MDCHGSVLRVPPRGESRPNASKRGRWNGSARTRRWIASTATARATGPARPMVRSKTWMGATPLFEAPVRARDLGRGAWARFPVPGENSVLDLVAFRDRSLHAIIHLWYYAWPASMTQTVA